MDVTAHSTASNDSSTEVKEAAESRETSPIPEVRAKKEVHIVVVGRSGAGKSTLLKNVFGLDIDTEMSASQKTQDLMTYDCENTTYEKINNGVKIKVTDTVGFIGSSSKSEKKHLLKDLSMYVKGEADLVIYCLPVSPGSRFGEANPSIMRSLQDAFSKDIWKHCMVALTFSNLAWDRIRRGNKDEESEYEEYKKLLKEYVDLFQRELKTLKVCDVEVRSIFDAPADKSDKHTIMCVPAGYDLDDQVLADGRYRFEESGEPLELTNTKWSDVLVAEILKACKPEFGLALLQFWHGKVRVAQAIKCHSGKMVTAAGVGGMAAGATLGIVGGPLGISLGAAVGLTVGIISSALVTTGAVAFLKTKKAIKSPVKSGKITKDAEETVLEGQDNSISPGTQDSS